MIDHVIFDLDGTLVDSAAVCCDIFDEMLLERGGGQVCRVRARDLVSMGGTAMVAGLLGEVCGDPSVEIAEFRRRYVTRDTPPGSLYDGVREGLEELRTRGYVLAVCSNKPQNLCDKVLADLGLADLFTVITGRSGTLRAKPATDLMDATFSGLGICSQRCIFVGDNELDYQLALACDMPFLFVTYGYCDAAWTARSLRRHDTFQSAVLDIVSGAANVKPAMQRQCLTA